MSISIQFPNSNDVFYPGQLVAGIAILDLREDINARTVTVTAEGKACCNWKEWERERSGNREENSTSTTTTVNYSSTVSYLDLEVTVWKKIYSGERLSRGHHEFPFQFTISPHCAPSFEGEHGSIRYEVKVEIDRVWMFNSTNRKSFKVAPLLDLNTVPDAARPVDVSKNNDIGLCLFRDGKIKYEFLVSKRGYVAREKLIIEIQVENNSSRPVTEVSAELCQKITFTAFRNEWARKYEPGLTDVSGGHEKRTTHVLAETREDILVERNSFGRTRLVLTVPSTMLTMNCCPTIKVEHYVTFKLSFEGCCCTTLENSFPVIIGTVPIGNDPENQFTRQPTLPQPVQTQPYPMAMPSPAPPVQELPYPMPMPIPAPVELPYPISPMPIPAPVLPTAPSAESSHSTPYPMENSKIPFHKY